ncbi:MAG: tetratricopeptide repeat protein, partial [Bacteroidota bacterium]|nr:tetratricopeptide repeat protein [Bacteroidota bacterium]
MSDTPKLRISLLCVCLFAICFSGYGQSAKAFVQKGDRFFYKKDYANALVQYEQALGVDPGDAETNFKAGVCLVEGRKYSQAVTVLERAHQAKPDIALDIEYHLGLAYQGNHQYAEARTHFESLLIKNKSLASLASQKIALCVIGDSLMRIPSNARVVPVGDEINTSFSEFSPLPLNGGTTLIFTSNRSEDDYQIKSRTNTGDVYITSLQGNAWGVPQKISDNINVRMNEVATSVSADGKTLFLYYEGGGGDIYTSTFSDGKWLPPVALNRFVNHPQYRESSACISSDGTRLYFSSNRPGGKGGFDLYVCEMGPNGQWGRPSNLGSRINTRRDEETPYLTPGGKTLYFSSDGH